MYIIISTLFIFIVSQADVLGEKFLIGFLTAGAFSLIMAWAAHCKKKDAEKDIERQEQLRVKQVQRKIAQDAKVSDGEISGLDYSGLYDELKEKCNPSNFMNPYDSKKVDISNSIFSQLDIHKNNTDALIKLRNQAISELGLSFSTAALFEKLSNLYNPSNFMDEHYDAEKLAAANDVYQLILSKKDNIIELEKIAIDMGVLPRRDV